MATFFIGGTGPGIWVSVGWSFLGSDPSQVRVVWELVSVPTLLSFPSQASCGLLSTAGDLAFGLFRLSRNKIKEGRGSPRGQLFCLHMKGPPLPPGMGAA